ncbi:putative butyrate kinase [Jeotgalicoccus coquinae]|uniref:Probable butyrate kinase n=1 Tax=Jeotgalicoccus coquinae TaxID=709509 RepID=A0A6V7R9W0_9STAP|nr:butyrate kinase [Jeotgalicoccus coquinae]MBB6422905.1 butyrate kinase [Jeotgalicoccus coquinae]GGE12213.1 putative butyrate kinase [Jeotgalicoccus coquinae]CAD2073685.1 Butyrate kinase 2 [Jeotgalicoccus coquinae]
MEKFILVLNLGSTTTKVALFRDLNCHIVKTYSHDKGLISRGINEQKSVRYETIIQFLKDSKVAPEEISIVAARGGLLQPVEGGTYLVNEDMLDDLTSGKYGDHASNLSGILAAEFAGDYDIEAVITDPVVVDELCIQAQYTGIKGIRRTSIFHALNQKAVARKYAAGINKNYEDLNLIVIHMGGGITVGAHHLGRVIDVNNGLNGDGPMSPTRAGSLPVNGLLKYLDRHNLSHQEINKLISKQGGLLSHLNTEDVRDIVAAVEKGDTHSAEVLEAMAFQIGKEIGAKAAVLHGQVDQIIFTGGVSRSEYVMDLIKPYISFLAPITVYPGELEMEALAYGAYTIEQDRTLLKTYRAEVSHD